MPFRDVIGHARQVTLLSRAVQRGSVPPTLLFAGPSGVGKWRVAQALAQGVNCLALTDGDACGTCRSCDRITRDMHVDVITLEPDDSGVIKIDPVREVLSRTGFRPFEGQRRVVAIRDADALNEGAQNALLKSLEEPPPATVFIMTTSVPGSLLPTVRSRSMTLRFGRLPAADVAAVLVRDFEQTEAQARALAALADGSIGHALALENADVSALRETALLLLQQAARRDDAQGRLEVAATIVGPPKKERARDDLALVFRLTGAMLRDIEAINSGVDPRLLANPIVADDLQALARRFGGDRARDAFAAVDRALFALERNAGAKVVAEWLSLQL
jgi:DNA polymerase-3 subunit delta'